MPICNLPSWGKIKRLKCLQLLPGAWLASAGCAAWLSNWRESSPEKELCRRVVLAQRVWQCLSSSAAGTGAWAA